LKPLDTEIFNFSQEEEPDITEEEPDPSPKTMPANPVTWLLLPDSKLEWPTFLETSKDPDLNYTKKKSLKPLPLLSVPLWLLSESLDTSKPPEVLEPWPPFGPKNSIKIPSEDSTETGPAPKRRPSLNTKRNTLTKKNLLKFLLTELKNTAQSLESLPLLKWNSLTLDKRKTTLWKFKLMEDLLPKKLTLLTIFSKKKWELTLFSNKTKTVMFWESPKEKDSKVSSKDSELNICKRNPTEVTEKSDALEPGIHPELDGMFPEPVNLVITTEPKWTKKSTESEKEPEEDALIMLPPTKIWLTKPSPPWEDSPTMVLSETISLWSKDASSDPKKEFSC